MVQITYIAAFQIALSIESCQIFLLLSKVVFAIVLIIKSFVLEGAPLSKLFVFFFFHFFTHIKTGSQVDVVPVRRALISVSDKTGIVEFCTFLSSKGVEL